MSRRGRASTASSARWLALLCTCACVLGLSTCKKEFPPCPLQCGLSCLQASACAATLTCPADAPCDPCSGQCRARCTQQSDCLDLTMSCCASAGNLICLDTKSDLQHCGGCDTTCAATADVCLDGSCVCGTLGQACAADQLCCDGTCVPSDENNCGQCGLRCMSDDLGDMPTAGSMQVATALRVDEDHLFGTNDNGVVEPGETVLFVQSWKNLEPQSLALSGTATSFIGPTGATYTIAGATADFGSVPSGATAACDFATAGKCYALQVSLPASRPSLHWDATLVDTLNTTASKAWKVHIGQTFSDVLPANPYYRSVEIFTHLGYTAGCGGTSFCPNTGLNRGNAAVFLARAIAGVDTNIPASGTVGAAPYNCTSAGPSIYADLPPTTPSCRHVHYLAARKISDTCPGGGFCPTATMTRGDFAGWVARGLVGAGNTVPTTYTDPTTLLTYDCQVATPNIHFTDADQTTPFCAAVHYLWARGAAGGCTSTMYCPAADETRGQAAALESKAFNLLLYGP